MMRQSAETPLSLRRVTFRVMGAVLSVLTLAVFSFLYLTIPGLLLRGENSYFEKQLSFIEKHIDDMKRRAVIAADNISVWNETAEFAKGKNIFFIEENWPNTTPLEYLGYDFIIIRGASGENLYAEFHDRVKDKITYEQHDFSDSLSGIAESVLGKKYAGHGIYIEDMGESGAHVYEGKLCILAVMPILENYEQQIPYGTVTMGHVLDLEYVNTVMFQNITSISILNDEPSPGGASVYPLNAGEMGLKFALDRADGGMPLDVRLNTPRIFYAQGKEALHGVSVFIVAAMAISVALLYMIINKYCIRPVEELSREIASVSPECGLGMGSREQSREFAGLRLAVNDMLLRLKESGVALNVLQSVVSNTDVHIIISDADTDEVLFVNEPMLSASGLTGSPVGRKCWQLVRPHQDRRCTVCFFDEARKTGKHVVWDDFCRESGKTYRNTGSFINWFDGRPVRLHNRIDITELRKIEELRHSARSDALTGLGNRAAYLERVGELARRETSLGVAFIDLNELKYVNDNYGHSQGDAYICALSMVFCRHFRMDDIFRIGGDEFFILCPNMPEELFYRKIKGLRMECEERFPGSVAMGAVWSGRSADMESLAREADRLMYADKQGGKALRKGKAPAWKPSVS